MRHRLGRLLDRLALMSGAANATTLTTALTTTGPPSVFLAAHGLGRLHLWYLIPAALWASGRRRIFTAMLVIATSIGWLWKTETDLQRARQSDRCHQPLLTIASANVLWTNDRMEQAADRLATLDTDLLITVETTPDIDTALRAHGWVAEQSGRHSQGTMITMWTPPSQPLSGDRWSRPPTWSQLPLPGWSLPVLTIYPTGFPQPISIVGVHIKSPIRNAGIDLWTRQLDHLHQWVASHPHPVVLAGDFNASIHHRVLHPLLRRTADAATSHHHTPKATWPSSPLVPVMDLDHILVDRHLAACAVHHFTIPGSDHRGLRGVIGTPTPRHDSATTDT